VETHVSGSILISEGEVILFVCACFFITDDLYRDLPLVATSNISSVDTPLLDYLQEINQYRQRQIQLFPIPWQWKLDQMQQLYTKVLFFSSLT